MGLNQIRLQPNMDFATLTTVLNNNAAGLENADISLIAQKGTIDINRPASAQTWVSLEHNLDYVPTVRAYINGASIGSITTNGSLLLPTWTDVSVSGGNVNFQAYLTAIPDEKYVHFVTFNATGGALADLTITYYLLKETAAL